MSKYKTDSELLKDEAAKYNAYEELINEFVLCINETRYYDAHEKLEEIWFPRRFEDDPEIKLIKGFINGAVSFELIKKSKPESSKKVWKNYEKYIILLGSFESPLNGRYQELDLYLRKKKSELTSNI